MSKRIKIATLLLSSLACSMANADENAVKQALTKAMPSVKIDSVVPSEIKGLYEVTMGPNIYYVSDDGKYLVQGRLVDLATKTDLTEAKLSGTRKLALEKLGQANSWTQVWILAHCS